MTFFEHIAEYERLYRALLGSRGSSWFVKKMRASLADMVTIQGHGYRLSADRPAPTFFDDLVPDLVSTMLVEAIIWWLEQGRSSSPRDGHALRPADVCILQGSEHLALTAGSEEPRDKVPWYL